MKRTHWQRVLAFVVALTLMFELLPMNAFAVEDTSTAVAEAVSADESVAIEPDVVAEVTELRDSSTKHFRLSDGSYAAVEYGTPVHYQTEDDTWEEIDNTLIYTSNRRLYLSENGDEQRGFAETLRMGQPVFVSQYGDYEVELALLDQEAPVAEPESVEEAPVEETVSVETETMEAQEAATEPAAEPSETVKTTEVTVPAETEVESSEETSVTTAVESEEPETEETTVASIPAETEAVVENDLNTDEIVVSDGEETETLETVQESTEADIAAVADQEVTAEETDSGVPAIVINPGEGMSVYSLGSADDVSLTEQYAPKKLGSTVIYEDVFSGVDLMYENYSYNIKETILVNEPQESYAYRFLLTTNELDAVLEEDGSINLYANDGTIAYTIPAPYMYDAANEVSHSVEYTLEETCEGYVLTVTADKDWIENPNRDFPVAIDPTLIERPLYLGNNGLWITYVVEGNSGEDYFYTNEKTYYVGYGSTKETQIYVHAASLPEIKEGCSLVGASLAMYHYAGSYTQNACPSLEICAYPVTSAPSSGTYTNWIQKMTWDTKATYNTNKMLDYAIASSSATGYQQWDLTMLAEEWYENQDNDNRTIALVGYESGEYKSSYSASAVFSGSGTYNPPMLIFQYRSAIGLEDYYTYQSHDIGYAGTAYIGDYSGQLIISNSQAVNASVVMPFSLDLIYNSYYYNGKFKEVSNTGMQFGNGWKLDAVQKLIDDPDNTNYKIHIDGDGTYHYYAKSGNVWKDEDGLNLEIKTDTIKGSSGSGSVSGYAIINDQGEKLSFYNGLLVQHTDKNGNAIRYIYNGASTASGTAWLPTSGTTNRLTKTIQSNVNQSDLTLVTLTYDSDGYLTGISDRGGNTTAYTYNKAAKVLTKIAYSSGHTAEYGYSSGCLTSAKDVTGNYYVSYGFSNGRVSGFREYAHNGSEWKGGTHVLVTGSKDKTVYRMPGTDGKQGTSDDILSTYLFDDAGRTCNAYTTNTTGSDIYGASVGAYKATDGTSRTNNHLDTSASIGTAAMNLVQNCSFETVGTTDTSATYWTLSGIITGTNIIVNADNHRTGNRSLKTWVGSGMTDAVQAKQTVAGLTSGQTYTLSAYVNTTEAQNFNADGVYLTANNSTTTVTSLAVNSNTSADIEDGWTRISVTFTAGSSNTIGIVVSGVHGVVYVDDVQVEKGDAPSNLNLVSNCNMSRSGAWTLKNANRTDGVGVTSTAGMAVTSTPISDGYIGQTIPINLSGNQTYVLSGWANATAVADNLNESVFSEQKKFGLKALIEYFPEVGETAGTKETFYAPFSADIRNEWQYGSLVIIPREKHKTVKSITIYCRYNYNNGTAYFDNISLVREVAQTMKYDEDGNLESVTSTGLNEDTNTYENGNLIKTVTGGSGEFTYEYDDKHNLTSASNGVVTQTNTYAGAGNVLTTTLSGESTNHTLTTSAIYQSYANLLGKITDANGGETTYEYNTERNRMYNLPTVVTDPNGTAFKAYYNADGTVATQYIDGKITVANSYTNDNLTSIYRGGYLPTDIDKTNRVIQSYNLEYDPFDRLKSVSVGTDTLVTNTYTTAGNLQKQTYGNGDYTSYTYDNLGREKTSTTSDGKKATYFYNGDGALSRTTVGSTVYDYTYDALSRLIGSSMNVSGDFVLQTHQKYNENNQLVGQAWDFVDKSYSVDYTYDEYGMLTLADGTGFLDLSMTYDGLQRLERQRNWLFDRTYSYKSSGSNKTTNLVSSIAYAKNDSTSFDGFTLSYTYDANGNILTITDPVTGNRVYTYDPQGQMKTEKIGSTTHTYTYDTYGNIRTADGVEYTYGDDQWKDLLTAYDGESITYDAIGNPTSYYNGTRWTFGWSNGRELTSASGNGKNLSYTYDHNGVRLTKTVDGVVHNYYYASGKLLRETYTSNGTKHTLDFFYDQNGNPIELIYNGKQYYYVLNLQGDVIRIVNTSGATVATYQYNAWGKLINSPSGVGAINPLRYRGYYYDTETGFYYLQSRYYDPNIGRFINADVFASTGQGLLGYNMFAYCNNNPINYTDHSGYLLNEIGEFGQTLYNEIRNAINGFAPAYAELSGFASSDGPLFYADVISLGGAALVTIGAIGLGLYQAIQDTTTSTTITGEKSAQIQTKLPDDTIIYRYGGTNPGNLTPRERDRFSGLSFSTVPRPGAACTTIGALNATGVVYAVQDGPFHVSVKPVWATMDDWIYAGADSKWTRAVKSVVFKWYGGNE